MRTLAYHERHTTFQIPLGARFSSAGYAQDIQTLEALPIWSGSPTGLSLWDNQKQAIALGAAYARLSQPADRVEAGLIKMPTGSGSGPLGASDGSLSQRADAGFRQ